MLAWIVGTTGISKYNSLIINTMLNTVPTVVCVAIAAISFGIFIAYLRKVEKENAYCLIMYRKILENLRQ